MVKLIYIKYSFLAFTECFSLILNALGGTLAVKQYNQGTDSHLLPSQQRHFFKSTEALCEPFKRGVSS